MPVEFIRKFAEACVLHTVLNCSLTLFRGLLKRSIKQSVMFAVLVSDLLCESHINVSYQLPVLCMTYDYLDFEMPVFRG